MVSTLTTTIQEADGFYKYENVHRGVVGIGKNFKIDPKTIEFVVFIHDRNNIYERP